MSKFASDSLAVTMAGYNINEVRKQFPCLHQKVNQHPLIYFDTAASAQKPQAVLDTLLHFYQHDYANVHRGVHSLSGRATDAFEAARIKVQHFINAPSEQEIIFVRGATEGLNLLANTLGQSYLQSGDEIILSEMEHHSNIVPWQMLEQQIGVHIKVVPVTQQGDLDMAAFEKLFSEHTKLVSISHISNALGTLNPVKDIIEFAHQKDVPVILDSCQAAAHQALDVQALDCDFLVFSGHKIYGPTGIGAVYAKQRWLDLLPPYQGGGEMIEQVSFTESQYKKPPYKFEAGTPNIAGVIGLGAAIDFINALGFDAIDAHENELSAQLKSGLKAIPGVRLIAEPAKHIGLFSFVVEGAHALDIGTLLDQFGIAVRTGHHCAMPAMHALGVDATVRVSLGLYNTQEEVAYFLKALTRCLELLQ